MSDEVETSDEELRDLIIKLLCKLYLNNGLTLSEAYAVTGPVLNIDDLFQTMLNRKDLMYVTKDREPDKYEFTFKGLSRFFALFKDKTTGPASRDEMAYVQFVRQEARRIVNGENGQ